MNLLDVFANNRETVAGAIATMTLAILAICFGLAIPHGGIQGIERRLRAKHLNSAAAAKRNIRQVFALAEASGEDEDRCVNALLAGLDEWRRFSMMLENRRARLRRTKWSVLGLALLGGCVWLISRLGVGLAEFSLVVAWCLCLIVGLHSAVPLSLEILEHGLDEPSTPKELEPPQDARDEVVTREEASKAENGKE